ncbi:MAG: hypothetical protein ACLGXA_02650 [Acidobacteriota bacterium]
MIDEHSAKTIGDGRKDRVTTLARHHPKVEYGHADEVSTIKQSGMPLARDHLVNIFSLVHDPRRVMFSWDFFS